MELEGLEFQVAGNSQRASNALDALTDSLQSLKKATGGISGLSETASQIKKLNMAVNSFNSFKFQQFVSALESLYKIKTISIPETLQDSIAGIAGALTVIKKGNVQKLELMIETLEKTGDLKNLNLTNVSTQINELKQSFEDFNTDNFNRLANALVTLSRIKDIKIPPDTAERIAGIAGALTVLRDEHIDRLRQLASVLQEIPNVRMPTVRVNTVGLDQSTGRIEEARGAVEALREEITQSQSTIQQGAGRIIGLDTVLLEIAPYLEAVRVAFGVIRTIVSRLVGFFKSLASAIWKALEPLRKLVKEFMRLSGVALKKLGTALASPFVNMGKKVKSLKGTINGLIKAMGRIAIYRGIRTIIKELTSGIKEGIDNLYQYSRLIKGDFARSMDLLATDMLYLKNSLGAMVSPIINALAPAFDVLTDKIVGALNAINMLIARLTGKDTYTAAKKIAKAYNEIKNATIGIDELNIIGDGMEDYGDMFEELPIVDDIKNFADQLIEAFKNGKWEELGRTIGEKFNELIDMIDWGGIGEKIGYYLNGAIKTLYFFLTEADFEKLGKNLSDLFNGIVASVDWEYLGRLIVKEMTSVWDFIIGFLKGVDYAKLATGLTDFVIGIFSELTIWFKGWDWSELAEIFTTKVHDFFGHLDMKAIGKRAGEFLKTLFGSFREWLDNVNWTQVGKDLYNAITDFFKNFDFKGVVSSFFSMLGSAAKAIKDLLRPLWDGIVAWWNDHIKGDTFLQSIKNLGEYLVNFVDEYVLTPFFKSFAGKTNNADLSQQWDLTKMSLDEIAETIIGNESASGIEKFKMLGQLMIFGILKGIHEIIKDNWLLNFLVNPFLGLVRKLFGIHSPAETMIPIGNAIMAGLIEGMAGLLDSVIKFFENLLEGIQGILNAGVSFVVTAIDEASSVISAIGSAIESIVSAGASLVITAIDAASGVIKTIGETLQQVVSAGANLVITAIDAASGVINTVSQAAQALVSAGANLVITALDAASSVISTVANAANNLVSAGANLVVTAIDAASSVISSIGSAVNSLVSAGATLIITAIDAASGVITAVGQSLQQVVSAGANVIITAVDQATGVITSIGSSLQSIISSSTTLTITAIDAASSVIRSIGAALVSVVSVSATLVITALDAASGVIRTIGKAAQSLISSSFELIITAVDSASKVIDTIGSGAQDLISATYEFTITAIDAASGVIRAIASTVTSCMSEIMTSVSSTMSQFVRVIGNAMGSSVQSVSEGFVKINGAISESISSGITTVSNGFNRITQAITNSIANAIEVNGIRKLNSEIDKLPRTKDIEIKVNSFDALMAIYDIIEALNKIPREINVTVKVKRVDANFEGGIIPHATGGIIPHATGGIVKDYTLFKYKNQIHSMGEMGREAILPLDSYTGWMDEIADKVEKRVSANGNDPDYMTFEQALADFYMSYMEPVMSQMNNNMQRQADKDETTVVKISDRDIRDSYNRQIKRDGYQFTR